MLQFDYIASFERACIIFQLDEKWKILAKHKSHTKTNTFCSLLYVMLILFPPGSSPMAAWMTAK